MKPKLLKIYVNPSHSFSNRYERVPYFYNEWHYHPEIELVYIEKGSGTQFIGNDIDHFNEGDMVLLGSNLPHLWKCDEAYFKKDSQLWAESNVLHFLPDVFGDKFMHLPENKLIFDLLEKAKHGIKIFGDTKDTVFRYLQALQVAQLGERILVLLQILYTLSNSKELTLITINNMQHPSTAKEGERMNNVFQYLVDNFNQNITLEDISAQANLSPNAFCRFFKARTKKTFSQFLMEMRVSHACKLLSETEKSIAIIFGDCGFNNSSHFNRYFKMINGITPLEYRKKHWSM